MDKESVLRNVADKSTSTYTSQWENVDQLYPRISKHLAPGAMVREFEGSALSALLCDPATFKS